MQPPLQKPLVLGEDMLNWNSFDLRSWFYLNSAFAQYSSRTRGSLRKKSLQLEILILYQVRICSSLHLSPKKGYLQMTTLSLEILIFHQLRSCSLLKFITQSCALPSRNWIKNYPPLPHWNQFKTMEEASSYIYKWQLLILFTPLHNPLIVTLDHRGSRCDSFGSGKRSTSLKSSVEQQLQTLQWVLTLFLEMQLHVISSKSFL